MSTLWTIDSKCVELCTKLPRLGRKVMSTPRRSVRFSEELDEGQGVQRQTERLAPSLSRRLTKMLPLEHLEGVKEFAQDRALWPNVSKEGLTNVVIHHMMLREVGSRETRQTSMSH